jgi:type I restriction enzyme S subunit
MKEGWTFKSVKDVAQVIAGQSPEGRYYNTEGVGLPFYQGKKEFGEKHIKPSGVWTSVITKTAIAGDILMSVRAPVGPVNVSLGEICIGRGLAAIRQKDNVLHDFLFYFFKYYEGNIKGNTGAVFDSINKAQIENIPFLIPPLPEQKRIVSIIDKAFEAIDKAIENTQKNLQNAKELFESHLNSVFENDDEGWERKKLGDIASVQYGYTDKSFDEGQFRYIRITDISPDGTLIAEDKKYLSDLNKLDLQDYILEHHDLLMARTGATFAKVLLYENLEPSVFASYLIKIKFKVHIENELYWYFTKTKMYWLQAHHLSSGSAQPQFNGAALKQLEVSYPTDIVKQKELIKEFKELLLKVTELESQYQQKLRDLEELKKSILNKAFAGEL